jgi:hypothetical protein
VAGFVVKSAHGYRDRLAGIMNGDPITMVVGVDRGRLLPGCDIPQGREQGLNYCLSNRAEPVRYAVVGDSKAEALFYGLVRESAPDLTWALIGTVYPPGSLAASEERLSRRSELVFSSLETQPALKTVLLVTAMRTIYSVDPQTGLIEPGAPMPAARLEAYSAAIARLLRAGKQVIFVMDHPTFPDPTSCVSGGLSGHALLDQVLQRKENPHCRLARADHLAGTRPYRAFVVELQRRHSALQVYDPTPLLCDAATDTCPMTREGSFLYSYGDHLSDRANSMLARDLLVRLQP